MRTFLPILLICGLVAGYFSYKKWRTKQTERYWADQFRAHVEPFNGRSGGSDLFPDEAAFFRLIYFIDHAEKQGVDVPKMMDQGCELMGFDFDGAATIKQGVQDNMNQARKFGILEGISDLLSLEKGDAPTISSGDWAGQKIVVGQKVSPVLASESALHIANLQLMPEIIRAADEPRVSPGTEGTVRALQNKNVIKSSSLDRINTMKLKNLK